MTDDLGSRLERIGSVPAPDPDPAFVTELARRLRAGEPTSEWRVSAWSRGRLLVAVAAGAATSIVIVILALASRVEDYTAQITAASGGDVVLPGGSVVPAAPGQKLPEGAVIRTGPADSIKAEGTDLGPDQAGVVRDGKVVPTSLPPATRPPAKSDTAPSTRPPASDPVKTTRPPDPKPAPMRIEVRRADGGVTIHWSVYDGQGFDRYVVLRRDDGEPVYGDPATKVLAEIRDRALTRTGDREPVRSSVYRVVAIDAEGRVLAVSPVAKVPAG